MSELLHVRQLFPCKENSLTRRDLTFCLIFLKSSSRRPGHRWMTYNRYCGFLVTSLSSRLKNCSSGRVASGSKSGRLTSLLVVRTSVDSFGREAAEKDDSLWGYFNVCMLLLTLPKTFQSNKGLFVKRIFWGAKGLFVKRMSVEPSIEKPGRT